MVLVPLSKAPGLPVDSPYRERKWKRERREYTGGKKRR